MVSSAKRWCTVETDASAVETLAQEANLPPAVATILVSRGIADAELAGRFLNPRLSDMSDPFLLSGMAAAVERVMAALARNERIVVFGDYDADGITGTALLVSVLRAMGGEPAWFLPDRLVDGYGLTVGALQRCIDLHQPDLVITVDCGTGAADAVEMARGRGADVVVTDHHEASGTPVDAVAVVNPGLGANREAAHLAGVGVCFTLCHALVKRGLEEMPERVKKVDLRDWLHLVAIGTVADVVPIVGENRTLVRHGLARLNKGAGGAGMAALKQAARLSKAADCYHIGFVIGPRLNAPGRLGKPDAALELLLTDDPMRASELADQLESANAERRRIEDTIRAEAEAELETCFDADAHFGLVVGRKDWHAGTIGIVASRLCARYGRPAVVVAFGEDGMGKGSCRSIEGIDVVAALERCSGELVSFGGHKMAAGLVVEHGKFEGFRDSFNAVCAEQLKGRDLRRVQSIDAWISLADADARLLAALDVLRPFGTGNPTPVLGARKVTAVGPPRRVGRDHLKMLLACGGSQLDAIGFGMADREVPEGPMDVLFYLQEDNYRGRSSLQLNLRDFASHTSPDAQ